MQLQRGRGPYSTVRHVWAGVPNYITVRKEAPNQRGLHSALGAGAARLRLKMHEITVHLTPPPKKRHQKQGGLHTRACYTIHPDDAYTYAYTPARPKRGTKTPRSAQCMWRWRSHPKRSTRMENTAIYPARFTPPPKKRHEKHVHRGYAVCTIHSPTQKVAPKQRGWHSPLEAPAHKEARGTSWFAQYI